MNKTLYASTSVTPTPEAAAAWWRERFDTEFRYRPLGEMWMIEENVAEMFGQDTTWYECESN